MASLLRDHLREISRDILAPGDFHDRLAPAVTAYAGLLFELAGINSSDEDQRDHLSTPQGQAIGTFWAATCVKEVKRTQRFCRGLFKAVAQRVSAAPGRPAHVVYAGTGPFAALALPVMLRFPADAVQFTLLEVNPTSFDKLRLVIRELGLEPHIRRAECGDAAAWRVPDEPVDIVLSETMNRAMAKEPQAGIMLNFARQLEESVTFIPEAIVVRVGWQQDHEPPGALVEILSFDAAERRRIIDRTPAGGEWDFAPVTWRAEPRTSGRLVYSTSIRVFEDEALGHNDCSLTMVEQVSPRNRPTGATLQFRYRSTAPSGFEVTVEEVRKVDPGP